MLMLCKEGTYHRRTWATAAFMTIHLAHGFGGGTEGS